MSQELDLLIRARNEWLVGLNDLNHEFRLFEETDQDIQRKRIGSQVESSLLSPGKSILEMTQSVETHLKLLDQLGEAIESILNGEDEHEPKKKVKRR